MRTWIASLLVALFLLPTNALAMGGASKVAGAGYYSAPLTSNLNSNLGTVNFSRAGPATYINPSSGNIEYAPHNLIYPSLITSSSPWHFGTVSVTPNTNAVSAPDGSYTATAIVFNGPNQEVYNTSAAAPVGSTVSFYIMGSPGVIGQTLDIGADSGNSIRYTLTNSWQRVSVPITSAGNGPQIGTWNSATVRGTIYAWGVQLNMGSVLFPYIATTSSAYQGPRFESSGLLMEGVGSNLLPYSNTFSSGYTYEGVTNTTDSTVAPDGSTLAALLTMTGSSYHEAYPTSSVTITANSTYTQSVYAKAGTCNYVYFNISGVTSGNWVSAVFDLSNVSNSSASQTATGASSGTLVGTTQKYIGNGWFRLSLSASVNVTSVQTIVAGLIAGSTGNTFDAYGSSKIPMITTGTAYFYGAQLENSPVATSYIPNATSSTAARAADVLNWTMPQILKRILTSRGTIAADIAPSTIWSNYTATSLLYADINDKFVYNNVSAYDGTHTASVSPTISPNSTGLLALRFSKADTAFELSQVLSGAITNGSSQSFSGFSSSITTFNVGGGSAPMPFHIKNLRIYPSWLTDSILQSLS